MDIKTVEKRLKPFVESKQLEFEVEAEVKKQK